MSRGRLDGIARTHPILPIVLSKKDPLTNSTLPDFIEHELANHPDGHVPYLMSDFYGDYLDYVIIKQLKFHRNLYAPRHYRWNIRDTVDRLSKVAFLSYVRNVAITDTILKKTLSIPKEKPILAGTSDADHEDLDFRTFYLFNKEVNDAGKTVYSFKESIILEYLVAHYQALECIRKVATGKAEESVLTSAMRDSMKRLPGTGDIWRMTFGLLNMDSQTKEIQKFLLEEIIEETKHADTMNSFDITSLCVESIYESQNIGDLAGLIDEFTFNETLHYSNVQLMAPRYPYTICAVGYLVRASPEIYGLHMSNFNLNEERIAMLADPVNAVSDNNLQVLNLSHNPIGDKGMRKLQRFIVKASILTHLDLHECNIGDMGMALLSEFFMCLPLRYLRVSNNGINDKGLIRLCSNLHYIPTIEWLDFSGNNLTDKSVIKLGEVVSDLPNLRCLDLRKNQIGDAGADAISKALDKTETMSHVMLAENRIGETGAESLANRAVKTKSLKYINLSLNHIPTAGVLSLKKAETDHGDLTIQVERQGLLDESSVMDTTGVSDTSMNFREVSVDRDSVPAQDWERSTSMDLLAGRPDRDASIIHNKMMKKHRSLPRLDLRRSWHGASYNMRESMRSMGSNTLPRAKTVDRTSPESPTANRKSVGDTLKRTGDTLRRSTGNMRDSFLRGGSQLRDSLSRTSTSVRTSLRKNRRSQEPETVAPTDGEQPSTSKQGNESVSTESQDTLSKKKGDKTKSIAVEPLPVEQIIKEKEVIGVEAVPVKKEPHAPKGLRLFSRKKDSETDTAEDPNETLEECGEYVLDEKPTRKERLRGPLKMFGRKKDSEKENEEDDDHEGTVTKPEEPTHKKEPFFKHFPHFGTKADQHTDEKVKEEDIPPTAEVEDEKIPDESNSDKKEQEPTSLRNTLSRPLKIFGRKGTKDKSVEKESTDNVEVTNDAADNEVSADQKEEPMHTSTFRDTLSKPLNFFKKKDKHEGNEPNYNTTTEKSIEAEDKSTNTSFVVVTPPSIKKEIEQKEVVEVPAHTLQIDTKVKKPLKLFHKKKDGSHTEEFAKQENKVDVVNEDQSEHEEGVTLPDNTDIQTSSPEQHDEPGKVVSPDTDEQEIVDVEKAETIPNDPEKSTGDAIEPETMPRHKETLKEKIIKPLKIFHKKHESDDHDDMPEKADHKEIKLSPPQIKKEVKVESEEVIILETLPVEVNEHEDGKIQTSSSGEQDESKETTSLDASSEEPKHKMTMKEKMSKPLKFFHKKKDRTEEKDVVAQVNEEKIDANQSPEDALDEETQNETKEHEESKDSVSLDTSTEEPHHKKTMKERMSKPLRFFHKKKDRTPSEEKEVVPQINENEIEKEETNETDSPNVDEGQEAKMETETKENKSAMLDNAQSGVEEHDEAKEAAPIDTSSEEPHHKMTMKERMAKPLQFFHKKKEITSPEEQISKKETIDEGMKESENDEEETKVSDEETKEPEDNLLEETSHEDTLKEKITKPLKNIFHKKHDHGETSSEKETHVDIKLSPPVIKKEVMIESDQVIEVKVLPVQTIMKDYSNYEDVTKEQGEPKEIEEENNEDKNIESEGSKTEEAENDNEKETGEHDKTNETVSTNESSDEPHHKETMKDRMSKTFKFFHKKKDRTPSEEKEVVPELYKEENNEDVKAVEETKKDENESKEHNESNENVSVDTSSEEHHHKMTMKERMAKPLKFFHRKKDRTPSEEKDVIPELNVEDQKEEENKVTTSSTIEGSQKDENEIGEHDESKESISLDTSSEEPHHKMTMKERMSKPLKFFHRKKERTPSIEKEDIPQNNEEQNEEENKDTKDSMTDEAPKETIDVGEHDESKESTSLDTSSEEPHHKVTIKERMSKPLRFFHRKKDRTSSEEKEALPKTNEEQEEVETEENKETEDTKDEDAQHDENEIVESEESKESVSQETPAEEPQHKKTMKERMSEPLKFFHKKKDRTSSEEKEIGAEMNESHKTIELSPPIIKKEVTIESGEVIAVEALPVNTIRQDDPENPTTCTKPDQDKEVKADSDEKDINEEKEVDIHDDNKETNAETEKGAAEDALNDQEEESKIDEEIVPTEVNEECTATSIEVKEDDEGPCPTLESEDKDLEDKILDEPHHKMTMKERMSKPLKFFHKKKNRSPSEEKEIVNKNEARNDEDSTIKNDTEDDSQKEEVVDKVSTVVEEESHKTSLKDNLSKLLHVKKNKNETDQNGEKIKKQDGDNDIENEPESPEQQKHKSTFKETMTKPLKLFHRKKENRKSVTPEKEGLPCLETEATSKKVESEEVVIDNNVEEIHEPAPEPLQVSDENAHDSDSNNVQNGEEPFENQSSFKEALSRPLKICDDNNVTEDAGEDDIEAVEETKHKPDDVEGPDKTDTFVMDENNQKLSPPIVKKEVTIKTEECIAVEALPVQIETHEKVHTPKSNLKETLAKPFRQFHREKDDESEKKEEDKASDVVVKDDHKDSESSDKSDENRQKSHFRDTFSKPLKYFHRHKGKRETPTPERDDIPVPVTTNDKEDTPLADKTETAVNDETTVEVPENKVEDISDSHQDASSDKNPTAESEEPKQKKTTMKEAFSKPMKMFQRKKDLDTSTTDDDTTPTGTLDSKASDSYKPKKRPFFAKKKKRKNDLQDDDDAVFEEPIEAESAPKKDATLENDSLPEEADHKGTLRDTLSKPLKYFNRKKDKTPTPDEDVNDNDNAPQNSEEVDDKPHKERSFNPLKLFSKHKDHEAHDESPEKQEVDPVSEEEVNEEKIEPVQAQKPQSNDSGENEHKFRIKPFNIFHKKKDQNNEEVNDDEIPHDTKSKSWHIFGKKKTKPSSEEGISNENEKQNLDKDEEIATDVIQLADEVKVEEEVVNNKDIDEVDCQDIVEEPDENIEKQQLLDCDGTVDHDDKESDEDDSQKKELLELWENVENDHDSYLNVTEEDNNISTSEQEIKDTIDDNQLKCDGSDEKDSNIKTSEDDNKTEEDVQEDVNKEKRTFRFFKKNKSHQDDKDDTERQESSPETSKSVFKPFKIFHRSKGDDRSTPDKDASQSETESEPAQGDSETDEKERKKEKKSKNRFFRRKKKESSPARDEPIAEELENDVDVAEAKEEVQAPNTEKESLLDKIKHLGKHKKGSHQQTNDDNKDDPDKIENENPEQEEQKESDTKHESVLDKLKHLGKHKHTKDTDNEVEEATSSDENQPTHHRLEEERDEDDNEAREEKPHHKHHFNPLKVFSKSKGSKEEPKREIEDNENNTNKEGSESQDTESRLDSKTDSKELGDEKDTSHEPKSDVAPKEKGTLKLFHMQKTETKDIVVDRPPVHRHIEEKVIVKREIDDDIVGGSPPVRHNGATAV